MIAAMARACAACSTPESQEPDGRIAVADKGRRLKGKASLSVELTSLTMGDGRKVDIVTSAVDHEAAVHRKKTRRRLVLARAKRSAPLPAADKVPRWVR
jgi:hypothetical protein